MADRVRVAVAVINWNGAEHLEGCLDAFLEQRFGRVHADGYEVLVVDNASADGSAEILERYEQRGVRVLRNAQNRGYAGAGNDAIAATSSDVLVLANPDVRPAPDCLDHAIAALLADSRRGAVQPKLRRTVAAPSGAPVIDTTGHVAFRVRLFRNRGEGEVDAGQWDRPGEVFGVSGALAVYRRAMLDDVAIDVAGAGREVLDEDLFAFWEDVDLDWRAAMRGWSAWYEPAATALHERGGAGPRRTTRVEELNHRNRLLTLVKCDDPVAFRRALPGVLVTTILKTGELAVTDPRALFASLRGLGRVHAMLAKRRQVHRDATVPSAAVVARWFAPFDYVGWVRTWWRRVRGVPPGA